MHYSATRTHRCSRASTLRISSFRFWRQMLLQPTNRLMTVRPVTARSGFASRLLTLALIFCSFANRNYRYPFSYARARGEGESEAEASCANYDSPPRSTSSLPPGHFCPLSRARSSTRILWLNQSLFRVCIIHYFHPESHERLTLLFHVRKSL